MMRSLRRLVGALALVLGVHATFVPAGADVVEATEPDVGWWWTGRPSNTFPVAVEPAPGVPPGGVYVGSTPSGNAGIAALRYEWPEAAAEPVLTLTISEELGTSAIDACPAASPWDPVDGGPWDERPAFDCAVTVAEGTKTDDGTGIEFDLSSFVRDEYLDVVLVPRVDPLATMPRTFSVSFVEPQDGALVLTAVEEEGGGERTPDGGDGGDGGNGGDAEATGEEDESDESDDVAWTLDDDFDLPATIDMLPPVGAPSSPAPDPTFVAQPANALPPPLDVFPYSSILTLVLVVLGMGSYLARSLTRPVTSLPVVARAGSRAR